MLEAYIPSAVLFLVLVVLLWRNQKNTSEVLQFWSSENEKQRQWYKEEVMELRSQLRDSNLSLQQVAAYGHVAQGSSYPRNDEIEAEIEKLRTKDRKPDDGLAPATMSTADLPAGD